MKGIPKRLRLLCSPQVERCLQMIAIRQARIEDAPAVFAGCAQTAEIAGLLVSYPREISLASVLTDIQGSQGLEGHFLVAEENDVIVGHACLLQMSMLALRHIYRLTTVVHPGNTGRGIGRTLLGGLHLWARSNSGCKKIELLVRASNERAVHLYGSMGYVEEGRLRGRVRDLDGRLHDDLAMALFPDRDS